MSRTTSTHARETAAGTGLLSMVAATAAPMLLSITLAVLVDPSEWVIAVLLVVGVLASVLATRALVVAPLLRSVERARQRGDDLEMTLVHERAVNDLLGRLEQALRSTDGETETLRLGIRAISELVPEREVSLLLSVPGEPRVGWRVGLVDGTLDRAEAIEHTPRCESLVRGMAVSTASSSSIDACAHLQGPGHEVAATCVPMPTDHHPLGVVCVQGAPGELPDGATVRRIEWVVHQVGATVARQRAAAVESGSHRRDPLTGLPGPAAMRSRLRELVRSLSPFSVAVLDIDGHDGLATDDDADEALCSLAEVLSDTLRPDDLVCRLDGARFAAVLPQCSAEHATAALERVRERLVLALATDPDAVPITFSAGVVEAQRATSLDQILQLAESACMASTTAGGNRVTNAG